MIKTPIRYAGGKSRAIKYITGFIPPNTKKIISPFIGGASLEIHWAVNLGIDVVGYDIFDILVNYWNVQLSQPKELYNILKKLPPTENTYKEIKLKLKSWGKSQNIFEVLDTDYYKESEISLSDIEGAAYYYYNHNLSYGPMYMGWMSSIYKNNMKKYNSMINKVKNFRCDKLSISLKSFEESIPDHTDDFLYLDPPYSLEKDADNKMFKGIYPNPNYAVHHNSFDHEKLRDLLYNHNGNFILSYNNCETIREWYKDFDLYYPSWQYSYGQGETRIGKNKKDNSPKKSHEILIVKGNEVNINKFTNNTEI